MRSASDCQIGASADGLAHEYAQPGGASGGLAGALLKIQNPNTVKPQLTFNRLAHRNPDTPDRLAASMMACPAAGFLAKSAAHLFIAWADCVVSVVILTPRLVQDQLSKYLRCG